MINKEQRGFLRTICDKCGSEIKIRFDCQLMSYERRAIMVLDFVSEILICPECKTLLMPQFTLEVGVGAKTQILGKTRREEGEVWRDLRVTESGSESGAGSGSGGRTRKSTKKIM